MTYLFSAKFNAFYNAEDVLQKKEIYIANGTYPDDGAEVPDSVFSEFAGSPPPEGKVRAVNAKGMPEWVDIPPTPNSELRKIALATLSSDYQNDIEKLNRAWLAAAVNDGVNETAKKDVVLAQINTRKAQYASDRSSIIAQYPD